MLAPAALLVGWPLAAGYVTWLDFAPPTLVATLAATAVVILGLVRLGTRLYFDNEREKLEQLRMLVFFDNESLLLAFPVVYALLRELAAGEFFYDQRVYNLIRELRLEELMVQDSTITGQGVLT